MLAEGKQDEYIPYPHPHKHGLYRIPVWVESDRYAVCIGAMYYRMFDSETLPDKIKGLLTMIHAIPYKPREIHDINPVNAYVNMQDPRLDEIGWRVCDKLYILILDEEFLFTLHGGVSG